MGNNDITGARLVSKPTTKEYEDNYEKIFGKDKKRNIDSTCDACVSSRYDLDDIKTCNESYDCSGN